MWKTSCGFPLSVRWRVGMMSIRIGWWAGAWRPGLGELLSTRLGLLAALLSELIGLFGWYGGDGYEEKDEL